MYNYYHDSHKKHRLYLDLVSITTTQKDMKIKSLEFKIVKIL